MKTRERIASILKTNNLDFTVTGFQPFNLSELELLPDMEFQLPTNLRLGHLAEKIVSELIKSSSNYKVIYENVQLSEERMTIGEIDFIIQNRITKQLTHMELAYKFYLYDPGISSKPMNNWIGPNRNDSLKKKLDKLKKKQFPLLYSDIAKEKFRNVKLDEVSQALCFLVSLFIPFEYKAKLSPDFEKAIIGYYINLESFTIQHNADKTYYLPAKKEWGMDPSKNEVWMNFNEIEKDINTIIKEEQALLCWQKENGLCLNIFIIWW